LPRPSKAVPDVAIIDASLPLVGGLEVARQIRGRCPDTEIMAIAAHDAEPLARDLLHAGARAFLLKSERTRSVVAGVEALSRQKPYCVRKDAARSAPLAQRAASRIPAVAARAPRRSIDCRGPSDKEMSAILCLSIKTVETHRATPTRKLGITSTAGLVQYAVRNRIVEA
jgi:DNA-binding NarL/FixJ family response regulator